MFVSIHFLEFLRVINQFLCLSHHSLELLNSKMNIIDELFISKEFQEALIFYYSFFVVDYLIELTSFSLGLFHIFFNELRDLQQFCLKHLSDEISCFFTHWSIQILSIDSWHLLNDLLKLFLFYGLVLCNWNVPVERIKDMHLLTDITIECAEVSPIGVVLITRSFDLNF